LATTSNLASLSRPTATIDGEVIQPGIVVLLTGQTTATQNGLKKVGKVSPNYGAPVIGGTYSFDGSGNLSLSFGSTLAVGLGFVIYDWGNATSFTMNGVTYSPNTVATSGTIVATATSITLQGPASTVNTALIYYVGLTATADTDSTIPVGSKCHVSNGAANSGTYVYNGNDSWTLNSGVTTINTTGSSGASNTSAIAALSAQVTAIAQGQLVIGGTIAAVRAAGPVTYPAYVVTIDGNPKVTTVWKWNAAATGSDDGQTILACPALGYTGTTPGRYLFVETL
jgi:hypothetical protein